MSIEESKSGDYGAEPGHQSVYQVYSCIGIRFIKNAKQKKKKKRRRFRPNNSMSPLDNSDQLRTPFGVKASPWHILKRRS